MMKLVKDVRTRQYELTFLVPTNYTSTEITKLLEQIEAHCKKHKVTVVSQEEWGEKALAYAIRFKSKPVRAALYYHWVLEAPSHVVNEFERALRLTGDIIRFLLVVAEEGEVAQVEKAKSE